MQGKAPWGGANGILGGGRGQGGGGEGGLLGTVAARGWGSLCAGWRVHKDTNRCGVATLVKADWTGWLTCNFHRPTLAHGLSLG
jgi:hypothetical protein